jgi:accessory colonization factor AcfC
MKVNLTIKDRLVFRALFPEKGNLIEQSTIRDIANKIDISSDERKEVELKQEGPSLKWNQEKDNGKDFLFSQTEVNFLKDQIEKLDKDKQITSELLDLCLKIKR